MAFRERSIMSEKLEFVTQAMIEGANMRRLCKRYGVSPTTGYKWVNRFLREGESGLFERSRRPLNSPRRTAGEVEDLVVAMRKKNPAWGGRKIKERLERLGHTGIPSASTITEVLRRNGMIDELESAKHTAWQRFEHEEPNELLQMDFKGHFPAGNGRCHPLTVLDDHSRFLLVLNAFPNERGIPVMESLTGAFRRYGVPRAMITDNGSPWNHPSSNALTKLEIWLLRLGIDVKKSGIRHPQTMGKDERLHRSLKAEVLQGRSFRDLGECQDAFDRWRYVYNHERPHEALEMGVPADRYRISPRDFPERLPEIEYSANDSVRKVQMRGYFHFGGKQYWVGRSLHGLPVAVRPTLRDGVFDVYFCRGKILQINRNSGSPMGEPEC